VARKLPATTESIDWLADLDGTGSELPVFTPRDLSLSASEDMGGILSLKLVILSSNEKVDFRH
jgi:hypothetical protein